MTELDAWQREFRNYSVRKILEPLMREEDILWGHYTHDAEAVMQELQSNGRIIRPEPDDRAVVDAIRGIENGQALVIPESYPIIPDGYSALKFIKRGREAVIARPESRIGAMRWNVNLEDDMNGALDNIDLDEACSGYSIAGIRKGSRTKKIRLEHCYRGAKLFAESAKHGRPIQVRRYHGDLEFGGKYAVRVPSMSSDKVYEFTIENVPIALKRKSKMGKNERQHLANVYDLMTRHDCPAQHWNGLHYRRPAGEDASCPHIIAGYLAIMQDLENDDSPYYVALSPYVIPSDLMHSYAENLRTKTLREVEGKRRGLNSVMGEIMHGKALANYGMFRCYRKHRTWM